MVIAEVVCRMKKVRMEEMMGIMEILVAETVVVIGMLLWLVKLEAIVTMRIIARREYS